MAAGLDFTPLMISEKNFFLGWSDVSYAYILKELSPLSFNMGNSDLAVKIILKDDNDIDYIIPYSYNEEFKSRLKSQKILDSINSVVFKYLSVNPFSKELLIDLSPCIIYDFTKGTFIAYMTKSPPYSKSGKYIIAKSKNNGIVKLSLDFLNLAFFMAASQEMLSGELDEVGSKLVYNLFVKKFGLKHKIETVALDEYAFPLKESRIITKKPIKNKNAFITFSTLLSKSVLPNSDERIEVIIDMKEYKTMEMLSCFIEKGKIIFIVGNVVDRTSFYITPLWACATQKFVNAEVIVIKEEEDMEE